MFTVRDRQNQILASFACPVDAQENMRAQPDSVCVRRESDGVIMGTMPRNIPAAPPPAMWQSGAPRALTIITTRQERDHVA